MLSVLGTDLGSSLWGVIATTVGRAKDGHFAPASTQVKQRAEEATDEEAKDEAGGEVREDADAGQTQRPQQQVADVLLYYRTLLRIP